jgi:signal transduction histidine kinase
LGEAIKTETVVEAGLWNAFVDFSQVENAVLNLYINARDVMDSNAHLDDHYTMTHPDAAPGQYIKIAVSDTGSGMSPKVVTPVF